MKRIFFILLIIFCFFLLPLQNLFGSEITTFKDYSVKISDNLYPMITEYLSEYNQKITNKEVVLIENDISGIINSFVKENNIPITHKPRARIMISENSQYKAWMLFTEISIMDEEESIDEVLITWFILGKAFVIHIEAKNKVEI